MNAANLPEIDITPALREAAERSKAWPFEEARKIVARIEKRGDPARGVLFETGYGPSGLPHIGTFGEVARTTMVRTAFRVLTGDAIPTRLLCFSDDMDGLRKVPDNVPNKEMMRERLSRTSRSPPSPTRSANIRVLAPTTTPGSGVSSTASASQYEFASATDYYRLGPLRCDAAEDARESMTR